MTITTKSEERARIEHDEEKMMEEDEIGEREKERKGRGMRWVFVMGSN
jgi:hypothetical protein